MPGTVSAASEGPERGSGPTQSYSKSDGYNEDSRCAFSHEVKLGESLTAIAERYGVTLEDLAKDNGIEDSDLIVENHVLCIMAHAPGSNDDHGRYDQKDEYGGYDNGYGDRGNGGGYEKDGYGGYDNGYGDRGNGGGYEKDGYGGYDNGNGDRGNSGGYEKDGYGGNDNGYGDRGKGGYEKDSYGGYDNGYGDRGNGDRGNGGYDNGRGRQENGYGNQGHGNPYDLQPGQSQWSD